MGSIHILTHQQERNIFYALYFTHTHTREHVQTSNINKKNQQNIA